MTTADVIKLSHLKVDFANRVFKESEKVNLIKAEEGREWVLSKDLANNLT